MIENVSLELYIYNKAYALQWLLLLYEILDFFVSDTLKNLWNFIEFLNPGIFAGTECTQMMRNLKDKEETKWRIIKGLAS